MIEGLLCICHFTFSDGVLDGSKGLFGRVAKAPSNGHEFDFEMIHPSYW